MAIRKVGVLGAGLMGSGIAEVCAKAGYETVVREVSDALVEKGSQDRRLARKAVEKGKLPAAGARRRLEADRLHDAARGPRRLRPGHRGDRREPRRQEGDLRALDAACKPETIFCSNTSSLTITEMSAATKRPDRFVGLHFFNPGAGHEAGRGRAHDRDLGGDGVGRVRVRAPLGKEPIARSDNSGFVVNRLLVPYLLDAVRALEEGVGTGEDIDKGMELGCGHPMGPFKLLDFVGLDTTYSIAEIMFDEYREKRFAPPPLLKRMVLAGRYGKKSGRGFYEYGG